MILNIDIESDKCDFPECRHYEDGICLDNGARKDCIEIALAVLCARGKDGKRLRLEEEVPE